MGVAPRPSLAAARHRGGAAAARIALPVPAADRSAPAPGLDAAAPESRPHLHAVLLAHLDTQWRWTERDSAERFLPETVDANESLFERFPRYVLSFEGAYRYQLLQELWPERFERLRARVAERRWSAAGSALEAFDANLPAPESIVRQILYGSRWFERELAGAGRDLLLPDCFGFPASLPTLAVHCGIVGFSTQKLRKGDLVRCAFGVPFAYGLWRGADGSELLAALDPGEYGVAPARELGDDPAQVEDFAALAREGRPARRMTYFGVGDQGGALAAGAVATLERSVRPTAAIEVSIGASERIYLETSAAERAALPVYQGDLLLHLHASGCYTSRATLKRWNRTNERLARTAEAAAALAARCGRGYPALRLERAWTRFLAHQMHDDLTGTSIPAAYRISWNDEAIAANELAEILLDSLGAVAAGLDRRGGGEYLLFNPLGAESVSPVEVDDAALAASRDGVPQVHRLVSAIAEVHDDPVKVDRGALHRELDAAKVTAGPGDGDHIVIHAVADLPLAQHDPVASPLRSRGGTAHEGREDE